MFPYCIVIQRISKNKEANLLQIHLKKNTQSLRLVIQITFGIDCNSISLEL